MKLKASLMAALSLLVACGGGGDGPPVGRSPGEPVGLPLLDRPVQPGYSCQVTQPVTPFGRGRWGGAALAPTKPPLLALSDNCWDDCDREVGIAVAALERGALGKLLPISDRDMNPGAPTLAVNGERITLVWRLSGDIDRAPRLMLAQLDREGEVVTPPHPLPEMGEPESFAIAATGDGYGLVWTELVWTLESRLYFQRLDRDGEPLAAPTRVLDGDAGAISNFVGVGDGFAVVLGKGDEAPNRKMRYLGLDAVGRPYWGPVPFAEWGVSLLPRGRRVLVAWSHTLGLGLGSSIRIGWFSERGEPEGDTLELRAPIYDQDHFDAAWVELGDDLGLVWSRAYGDGGCWDCSPKTHLEFVVLDGETLEPKSDVVRIDWPDPTGLLTGSMLVADRRDVTIVTNIAFHRFLEGASAGVSCR